MGADSYWLVWSPEAEEDLLSIWKWGVAEWSEDVADRHLFEIEHACGRLINDPMFGKARDELIAGVRSLPVRPHIIFYRIAKRHVEIVRVVHQRMDVERVFSD
jgi:toxin ParE1/3/4